MVTKTQGAWAGLVLLLCLIVGAPAVAQLNNLSQIQIGLFQSQYLSEPQSKSHLDQYTTVGMQAVDYRQFGQWGTGFWSKGLYSTDTSEERYIAVPEVFLERRDSTAMGRVILGRKRLTWSAFDDEWGLGIWQPQLRWDYLDPETQGLTGLFRQWKLGEVEITAFVTGIFLPDQGPDVEVKNGELRSANRWFRAPITTMNFKSQQTRINYALDRPAEEDVIFKAGAAWSALWGQRSRGYWYQLNHAYKPMNQMHLGIQPNFDISNGLTSMQAVAIIRPQVIYHHVASVEAGWTGDDRKLWWSLTTEFPEDSGLPPTWPEASLARTNYVGIKYSEALRGIPTQFSWLDVAYLYSWRGSEKVKDPIVGDHVQSSVERLSYKNAARISWSGKLWQKVDRELATSLDYTYSFNDKGSIVSSNLKLKASERLRWRLGFDFLSTATEELRDRGMVSRYRTNDRVYGGFSYVF